MRQYLTWECKCRNVYGIERLAPLSLWEKHPMRGKCHNRDCDARFPDQEHRDRIASQQDAVITEYQ